MVDFTPKLLELINEYGRIAGYKINIQKLVTTLYYLKKKKLYERQLKRNKENNPINNRIKKNEFFSHSLGCRFVDCFWLLVFGFVFFCFVLFAVQKFLSCTAKKKSYQQSEKTTYGIKKILQIVYLMRGQYPEYIKNSYTSTAKQQIAQLKYG